MKGIILKTNLLLYNNYYIVIFNDLNFTAGNKFFWSILAWSRFYGISFVTPHIQVHNSVPAYPWWGSSAILLGSLRSVLMRTRLLVASTEATEMDLSPESVQYRLCWSQSTARPTGVCRSESTSGTCWEGSLASWMKALEVEGEYDITVCQEWLQTE